tara:strand:+ start:1707 stop:2447 length:741 start_codon:yes stop_codon:yes gene_type:complete
MNENVVIIPTFNEKENITITISEISKLKTKFDIVVVDDNSPDKTGEIVKNIIESKKYNFNIHLIERNDKKGLGSAYIEGFNYAISKKYSYIFQLDADGSHSPLDLEILQNHVSKNKIDVVIGSRYIKGITVVNWPIERVLLSYFANRYVNIITGIKVKDTTGGFNGYSLFALKNILKYNIMFEGYAFQIQLKFIATKLNLMIKEIPIIFKDRIRGKSKMSFSIFGEAIFGIIKMKLLSFFTNYKIN